MNDYVWVALLNLGVLLLTMIGSILLLRRMLREGNAIIDAKLAEDAENMSSQEKGECG